MLATAAEELKMMAVGETSVQLSGDCLMNRYSQQCDVEMACSPILFHRVPLTMAGIEVILSQECNKYG
jgi:hypothetical protein